MNSLSTLSTHTSVDRPLSYLIIGLSPSHPRARRVIMLFLSFSISRTSALSTQSHAP